MKEREKSEELKDNKGKRDRQSQRGTWHIQSSCSSGKTEEEKQEHWRAAESGEFTKAAQQGPHYVIKQDLISESDLMR